MDKVCQCQQQQLDNCVEGQPADIRWTLAGATLTVSAEFTSLSGTSWVSLGISPPGTAGMADMDLVMAYITATGDCTRDLHASGPAMPAAPALVPITAIVYDSSIQKLQYQVDVSGLALADPECGAWDLVWSHGTVPDSATCTTDLAYHTARERVPVGTFCGLPQPCTPVGPTAAPTVPTSPAAPAIPTAPVSPIVPTAPTVPVSPPVPPSPPVSPPFAPVAAPLTPPTATPTGPPVAPLSSPPLVSVPVYVPPPQMAPPVALPPAPPLPPPVFLPLFVPPPVAPVYPPLSPKTPFSPISPPPPIAPPVFPPFFLQPVTPLVAPPPSSTPPQAPPPALAQLQGCVDLGCPNSPTSQCRSPFGICDSNTGACEYPFEPDGTPCNDFDSSTVNDICLSRTCRGTNLCAGLDCSLYVPPCRQLPATCNLLTGQCEYIVLPDGTPCNDGLQSTNGDACTSGRCVGVSACAGVQCNADIPPCRQGPGFCNPDVGRCEYVVLPDGTPCNDGIDSTQDVCNDGICQGTPFCDQVVCPAVPVCQGRPIPPCDPLTGQCMAPIPAADGTQCDDGDQTTRESCRGGRCLSTQKCSGVQCTAFAAPCSSVPLCNPSTGLCETSVLPDGALCEDGDPTTDDVCLEGNCFSTSKCENVQCIPSSQCAMGTCNRLTGQCQGEKLAQDGTACDDGNPQTRDDVCKFGSCAGFPDLCFGVDCNLNIPPCRLGPGRCSEGTGRCLYEFRSDGTPCNDGLETTRDDVCLSGRCVGSVNNCAGVDCSLGPSSQCQLPPGRCNAITGKCEYTVRANGVPCNDGLPSTVNDAPGVCNPQLGRCEYVMLPDGTPCADLDLTTTASCIEGQCGKTSKCSGRFCPAAPECYGYWCGQAYCPSGNPSAACEPTTGVCKNPIPLPDGTVCDDGDDMTTGTCQQGTCT
eukprot:gene12452-2270_t